jgi:glycosyltransferase involved in cell wall biosynthesis
LPLLRELKKRGYGVILASPEDEYTPFLREEFELIPIKSLDRKGINPLGEIKFLKELIEILKRSNPHLVVNITIKPNIWGNIAAKILRVPSIGVITGLGSAFTKPKFPIYQIVKELYKFSLKHPRKVIFQNSTDAEFFKMENIVNPKQVVVIPGSGIDTEFFKPKKAKKNVKKKKDRFIFGYAGRLLWDKGIRELIEASKILKHKGFNFEIHIVGKPDSGNPNSLSVRTLSEWERQKLIVYRGFFKDVRPFLEEIDCFVYPSYREGLPRAVLEAMAMEKPVITTDAPGCRDAVVDGKTGFLVKAKNPASLARAMEKVMKLPQEKLLQMGKEGRKLVEERFSTAAVVPQYVSVIEEALSV